VNQSHWLARAQRVDDAVYAAVARLDVPVLDSAMRSVSHVADYSRPWFGVAVLLALLGGSKGRRAARDGVVSIAVTATVINAALKPLGRRRRPSREILLDRHVPMPRSRSFPSGHSASGFAFANGVAATLPRTAVPLRAGAGVVAYSRVHTGVHYPGDVLAGCLLGALLARLTLKARERRRV
jgi:membrane-associated phospholipid phosphatase